MKHVLASFVLVSGLVLVGCDKKDSATDVNSAANKTGSQAADAMDKAKSNVKDGVDQAKDNAKDNMDMVEKNIDGLISKAKDAVKDKKWSDAEGYIDQIKKMETTLPQAAQDKINVNLADVQKMIDAGKAMMPGK